MRGHSHSSRDLAKCNNKKYRSGPVFFFWQGCHAQYFHMQQWQSSPDSHIARCNNKKLYIYIYWLVLHATMKCLHKILTISTEIGFSADWISKWICFTVKKLCLTKFWYRWLAYDLSMTDAKFLTRLDLNSTHGDSRRTASDRLGLLFFTELHPSKYFSSQPFALLIFDYLVLYSPFLSLSTSPTNGRTPLVTWSAHEPAILTLVTTWSITRGRILQYRGANGQPVSDRFSGM